MQVAVLTEQLHARVPGGTGRYTADLLACLAVAPAPADTVVSWTARHRDLPDSAQWPEPLRRQLFLDRRTLSLAWSYGIGPAPTGASVVHAPTPFCPPRRGTALVVTVHDDVPWSHPQTLTRHGARWHRRMGERIGRSADVVVTPTAAVASRLQRILPGLTAARLQVVANPLPRERADLLRDPRPDEPERVRRLRLPDEGYLLFVGTQEPRKGLDVLLSALARPGGPRLPLLVVGPPGWGSVKLAELQHRVQARGRVADEDLAVLYRHATALVLPSRAEGFGYPVIEAMAAGTPVVVSDDPALLETGGDAVLATRRGDAASLARAVRRIEDDAGLRRDLVTRGRDRVLRFSDRAFGDSMWGIYSGL